MFPKTSLLLLLTNLIVIHGISYCCNGNNKLDSNKTCLDGSTMKQLNCDESFIIRKDDNSTKMSHDDADNLILDDDIVPPDEYCFTNLQSGNVDVYRICNDQTKFDKISSKIETYLLLVSVFFIILTVTVYFLIPEKLDLQEICLIHSISGLALAYLGLFIINLSGQITEGACHFLGYFTYFFFMYCFFWLNLLCFHIWRSIMNINFLERIRRWKIIYHVYGIGSPLLAVGWVMLVNLAELEALAHIHPGMGKSICWFKTIRESVIFLYGPIVVLLALNTIFFVWTVIEQWRRSRHYPVTQVLKYRIRMYCKLCFIMGLTWIFEVVSVSFHKNKIRWIWIVTDILNTLQGLIIFLIMVVFRKKLRRTLANKKICGWRFPAEWKNARDSECEEFEEAEYSLDTSPK